MDSNSVKNIKEEQSKNMVINGLKIKLPTAVIKENGSPHATITGKETRERKH